MRKLISTILLGVFAMTAHAQKPDPNFYIFLCFGNHPDRHQAGR